MATYLAGKIHSLHLSGEHPVKAHRPKSPSARALILACGLSATLVSPLASAVTIPNRPLIVTESAKPMTLLVVSKDHKLFYEAYNDASDIDGDGTLDTRFNPAITYYGLFDSGLCYAYSGTGSTGRFQPDSSTSDGKCTGTWSGNWLNYVTTSRIDALRKALYGGYREIDTSTQTILRRAYIPQDDHSWAKEYTSEAVDGYKISDYTPLSQPSSQRRHFFGNLTASAWVNCSTLNNCSGLPPLLRVVTNSTGRVWEWASSERPVLDDDSTRNTYGGGSLSNYTVRVEVCTDTFHDGCKGYPNGHYKPVGLLHDFGEGGAMLFGLITGSYNKNMSGGVLRKVVSRFDDELDPDTGQFISTADTIVRTLNRLRIRDYNNISAVNWDEQHQQTYREGWFLTGPMNEGDFVDWGNPVAEMMYEGLRYFAGKGTPTAAYNTSGAIDAQLGLPTATWDNPYGSSSAAHADWCSKANLLVMSDIYPSFDSDQLPGSYFDSFTGDLSGLDVTALAGTITAEEGLVGGDYFIGQSGTDYDGAPTEKTVTSLGTIRGLAPEEPTKRGSYYSASVAYFGKTHDLNPAENKQTTDSFFVALASPLPKIRFPVGANTVTLIPFAKSVGGDVYGQSVDSSIFAPTDQIVDFFVETLANLPGAPSSPSVNHGRPYAKFRINFEDVEQGADHDMDAIVLYEIQATDAGQVEVKLASEYAAGSIVQHMGYVISGTTTDGVYLTVRDADTETSDPLSQTDVDYVLDWPNIAGKLPLSSTQTFTPGGSSASLLENPLWYSAKWGGFIDRNNNDEPDLSTEWDADHDGVPDTYFPVQNPLRLKEALTRALINIADRSASGGSVTSNSTSLSSSSQVFQAVFTTGTWSGNLIAYPVTNSGVSTTPTWEAAAHIPVPAARSIFTTSGGTPKEFLWDQLTTADQTALGDRDVLNYVRGERTNELQYGGSLRDRSTSVLGDIVDSSPYYVKDTDTVYVGANDGMLHAFDASTGTELFAYIPSALIERLPHLANPTYVHKYFVDGLIMGSTRTQTPDKNYLVATLGRGGKGLFALDVTAPAGFSASNVKWEYFDASDADLGLVLSRPLIAKMNDGSTAVIVGNGYNSIDGKAVLYIFDLTTGTLIQKIDTGATGDNGLAGPGLFDDDGDGDIDYIYAGDLLGNLWKFDVTESDSNLWDVALYAASIPQPLFVAKDAGGNRQPITAPMTVAVDTVESDINYGKRFLFFGTGSYFQASDPPPDPSNPPDPQVQTWYGLIDEGTTISGRGDLTARAVVADGTFAGRPVRAFSTPTAGDMVGKSGWYIDLTDASGTAEGEQIVTASDLYSLAEQVLLASSIIPAADPCLPGGRGFVNAISPFTGARLYLGFFDVNGNDSFSDDTIVDALIGGVDLDVGMPAASVLVGDRLVVGGSSGDIEDVRVNTLSPIRGRVSWRQIIQE